MIHDEKKIKIILSKTNMVSFGRSNFVEIMKAMKQYAEHIRKQTIEECEKLVHNQKTFTGGSSIEKREYRINKVSILSALNDLE